MTKKELVELLLNNFVDEDGDLDLSELDFSKFEGDVNIGNMKVRWNLLQSNQQVGQVLFQENQIFKGIITVDTSILVEDENGFYMKNKEKQDEKGL